MNWDTLYLLVGRMKGSDRRSLERLGIDLSVLSSYVANVRSNVFFSPTNALLYHVFGCVVCLIETGSSKRSQKRALTVALQSPVRCTAMRCTDTRVAN